MRRLYFSVALALALLLPCSFSAYAESYRVSEEQLRELEQTWQKQKELLEQLQQQQETLQASNERLKKLSENLETQCNTLKGQLTDLEMSLKKSRRKAVIVTCSVGACCIGGGILIGALLK